MRSRVPAIAHRFPPRRTGRQIGVEREQQKQENGVRSRCDHEQVIKLPCSSADSSVQWGE